MAAVHPPSGMAAFRLFTADSLAQIERLAEEEGRAQEAVGHGQEVEGRAPEAPNVHLEAGKSIPMIYGDPPGHMLNTPLEDPDPFYRAQKTFIVVSRGSTIFRFNAEPACYSLTAFSRVRRGAIKVLIHSYPSDAPRVKHGSNHPFTSL
ncbi:unnamed protein product [Boreogadus saida]